MEENAQIVNENVSVLLDQLLKAEDPATIGIRRILRNKIDEHDNFSQLKQPPMESFEVSGKASKKGHALFNDQERSYLELEKRVRELERSLTQEKVAGKRAAAESFERGRKEGFEEGEKKGFEDADKKFTAEVNKLKDQTAKTYKKVEQSKAEMICGLEHVLLKFCIELTKKIIAAEVNTNPEIVLAVIKKSLALIADRDKILIRVAPGDLETASGAKDFLSSVTERLEHVQFEADDRIKKGGCIVESNSGMVDARLGVQLEELEQIVEDIWESAEVSG